MKKHICERKNILTGRTMENRKSSEGVRPLWSLETSLPFLVSARRRFALRSRMIVPDVSLIRMSDMMKVALAWYCQQPQDASWSYTHNYGDKPKVPSPSIRSCQEASDDLSSRSVHDLCGSLVVVAYRSDTGTNRWTHNPYSHRRPTLFAVNQIRNCSAPEYERCTTKS